MNAIEISGLNKNFKGKQALSDLNMTVPVGAIYGFIGENGSGKSTTEKIICGLINKTSGNVKIFDRDYNDQDVRSNIGVLIESPGCFPNLTVWNNLMIQATNLSLQNKADAVRKVLTMVRMEGAAGNKFKNCSLGMKQRIGIAMALLGDPKLLVLDEPINGLDADGMRIMREVLTALSKKDITIIISSHILSELEKIATHYGIIRNGKMIVQMTSEELEKDCPTFISLKTIDIGLTKIILEKQYKKVIYDEQSGFIRIYDKVKTEDVVKFLYKNNIIVIEIKKDKISLEEYYINLMNKKEK